MEKVKLIALSAPKIILPQIVSGSSYEEGYLDLCRESLDFYGGLRSKTEEKKAIEIVPRTLSIFITFNLDGYDTLSGFIYDRIQEESQWEIRAIARDLKNYISEENPIYGSGTK